MSFEGFGSREEAGRLLAEELRKIEFTKPLLLAIPRGGVVVGHEIANQLGMELDVIISRKIGAESDPEAAVGAAVEDGTYFAEEENASDEMKKYVTEAVRKEKAEIRRRVLLFRKGRKLQISGRSVILVDDGIATGYTMLAAIAFVKKHNPKEVTVAVPVAANEVLEQLRGIVGRIICLSVPGFFYAVGQAYEEFPEVSDGEALRLLEESRRGIAGSDGKSRQ